MTGTRWGKATQGNKRATKQLRQKQKFVDEARSLAFANFWLSVEERETIHPKARLP